MKRTLAFALAASGLLNLGAGRYLASHEAMPTCFEDEVITLEGDCVPLDNLTAELTSRIPGVTEVITDDRLTIIDITVDCDSLTIFCDDEGA